MTPVFIPQPKEFLQGSGYFKLPAEASIGICCQRVYGVADLARSLFNRSRVAVSIPSATDTLTIRLDGSLPAGGYRLRIDAQGIALDGHSAAAAWHGLLTLMQVVSQSKGGRLPALTINDWPDFQDRGVYYDLARGRVPKLERLMELADGLAKFKINQLQLYIEHTFLFRGHPDIGKDASPLTADDILRLDECCRARGVELLPSLSSFGHLSSVLKHPQYHELAEDWGVGKYVSPEAGQFKGFHRGFTLSPANPKVYDFLDSLYSEFLPLFSSNRFNICCDETWDLGHGQSYELSQKIGRGRLYLGHIIKLNDICRKYGKRIMFWGDIIRHYPELIPEIPKDVTVLDWAYRYNMPFEKIEDFAKAGLNFYACPSTSGHVSLFPRLHEAEANIAGFAAAGKKFGGLGLLNTDWGDGGHYNFIEPTWHGYLFGAEQAWNTAADRRSFTARFCKLFMNIDSPRFAKALDELGDISHLNVKGFYQSIWQHLLFAKPGDKVFNLPSEQGHECAGGEIRQTTINLGAVRAKATLKRLAAIRKVFAQFAAAKAAAKGADPMKVLGYWLFAIDTIACAARKLAALGPGGADTPDVRKALAKEMTSLMGRFKKLWLARNHVSEIRITLDRYQAAIDALK